MPPVNQCRYIEIWTSVKIRWGLKVDSTEWAALIRYADRCANQTISVPRV